MVAPDVEQFLSTVQRYVRSSGTYPPEKSSPGWIFVEMFRPSVNTAVERAVAYNKRMQDYRRRILGESGATAAEPAPRKSSRPKPPFTPVTSTNAQIVGRERARMVRRLITELNALRPHIQIPDEDLPRLREQHSKYLVFKICKNHPSASEWVKRLPERRGVNTLAYELAAIQFGVRSATIETAWKKYKRRSRGPR